MSGKDCREDFFIKRWRCPVRRFWLNAQGILMAYVIALLGWIVLDLGIILSLNPGISIRQIMLHSLLTVTVAMGLCIVSYLFFNRKRYRFNIIRLYHPSRRKNP
jgi:NADH:ubiquinone oxidoreductase subunit 3 (subunit A)